MTVILIKYVYTKQRSTKHTHNNLHKEANKLKGLNMNCVGILGRKKKRPMKLLYSVEYILNYSAVNRIKNSS